MVVVTSSFSASFKGRLGLGLNRCLGELNKETRGRLKGAEFSATWPLVLSATTLMGVVVCKLVRTRLRKEGREARGLKRRRRGDSVVVVVVVVGICRAGILVKISSSTTASANKFSIFSSARACAKSCSMDCDAAKDTKANTNKGPESL